MQIRENTPVGKSGVFMTSIEFLGIHGVLDRLSIPSFPVSASLFQDNSKPALNPCTTKLDLNLINISDARKKVQCAQKTMRISKIEPFVVDWLAFEFTRNVMADELVGRTKGSRCNLLPLVERQTRDLVRVFNVHEMVSRLDSLVHLSCGQKSEIRKLTSNNLRTQGMQAPGIIFKLQRPFKIPEDNRPHLDVMYVMGVGKEQPWVTFFRMTAFIILRSQEHLSDLQRWGIIGTLLGVGDAIHPGKSLNESMRSRTDWGFYFWVLSEEIKVLCKLLSTTSDKNANMQQLFDTLLSIRELLDAEEGKKPFPCRPALRHDDIYNLNIVPDDWNSRVVGWLWQGN